MLKQKKLATAVAALVVGASAATIGTAQAGVVFFPFLVNGPTVTSIVSTMNMAKSPGSGPYDEALHYRMYYKLVTDDHKDPCKEINVRRPTSKYDINTVDLGGKFGQGTLGVLFNDPSVINYPPTTGSFSFGEPYEPHRGYLIVDNGVSGEPLAGEMLILELTSGAAWGYQGIQDDAARKAEDTNFTGEASASPSQVAIMPLGDIGDDIITKFTVTPVGPTMAGIRGTQYASLVYLQTDLVDGSAAVAFDRDELPVSGGIEKKIVCVGVVEAKDLIDNAEFQLPDGGWSELNIDNPGDKKGYEGVDGAIVFKIEYGENTINNEPLQGEGIYNNGIRLNPPLAEPAVQ